MHINKKEFNLFSPAKINLNLKIVGKLNNGLHSIESKVCFVDLFDFVLIKETNFHNEIKISQKSKFKLNNDTLLKKTLSIFKKNFDFSRKYKIELIKNIPIGAGLGGGSSNAATLLIALRYFYNKTTKSKKISFNDIQKLSHNIGSDVPACLFRRSLNVSGSGEKIKPLSMRKNLKFIIIFPNIPLSTKKVFHQYKLSQNQKVSIDHSKSTNDLEIPACYLIPEIKEILDIFKSLKNIEYFGMSGSGSACFGVFDNKIALKIALEYLRKTLDKDWFIWHGTKKEFGYSKILY